MSRVQNKDQSLANDSNFIALLRKAGDDIDMQQTQDEFFNRVFLIPTLNLGESLGCKQALSCAVIYDSLIHGAWRQIFNITNTRIGSVTAVGEKKWITEYNATRRNWLANHSNTLLRNTVYRQDVFTSLFTSDKWSLELPIRVRNINLTVQNVYVSSNEIISIDTNNVSASQNDTRLLLLTNPVMTGIDIADLQTRLDKYGLPVKINGVFDSVTAEAVRIFQTRNNLRSDGIVGNLTRNILINLIK